MSSTTRDVTLPIPNGWFAVAFSKELVDGEVKRVRYFGEELVLFRTRSGRAAVLDAYCPHLGAHLAEGGRVVGESVRCPFHGWQWDADGNCAAIPYCKRIPPTAKTRAWPVIERKYLDMFERLKREPPAGSMEPMPGFLGRQQRTARPGREVLETLPAGAVLG